MSPPAISETFNVKPVKSTAPECVHTLAVFALCVQSLVATVHGFGLIPCQYDFLLHMCLVVCSVAHAHGNVYSHSVYGV